MQKIIVTELDLDFAIGLSTIEGADTCETCVLAVAVKRQIPEARKIGFYTVHGPEGVLGRLEPHQIATNLAGAFDDERYDDVRQLLPLTLMFIRG